MCALTVISSFAVRRKVRNTAFYNNSNACLHQRLLASQRRVIKLLHENFESINPTKQLAVIAAREWQKRCATAKQTHGGHFLVESLSV